MPSVLYPSTPHQSLRLGRPRLQAGRPAHEKSPLGSLEKSGLGLARNTLCAKERFYLSSSKRSCPRNMVHCDVLKDGQNTIYRGDIVKAFAGAWSTPVIIVHSLKRICALRRPATCQAEHRGKKEFAEATAPSGCATIVPRIRCLFVCLLSSIR